VRLLVLGGTRFVGRHLVEAALARGHEVTLFHRGRTNPGLFPAAERILGDRAAALSALEGRRWDAVLDVNGYLPREVRASARLLAGAVDLYVFISTISVYADVGRRGRDEESPLKPWPAGAEEATEWNPETYGGLKALCERGVDAALPGRALVVRPGLLVGPHDPTTRFPYWPWRIARGGEVLAPVAPDLPVQLLDVRDLASWVLRSAELGRTGTYNTARPLTLGEVLETCRTVACSDAVFTWVSESFLLEHGVEPWTGLPLWLSEGAAGFHTVDNRKAVAAGLTFRPLAETVRDTLTWLEEAGGLHAPPNGGPLTPEREAELLREWRAQGAPRP
jgi:2'-hydroxyisoflavone reductase